MLDDSSCRLEASLTSMTAEQLLQVPTHQFVEHVRVTQDQILESVLAQQFLFGLSCNSDHFQVDAVSPVA